MSTTDTPTETLIEYGYREDPSQATQWPDEDGDVEIAHDYYNAVAPTPAQVERLRAAAKKDGGQLFERTVTKGAERLVKTPLPTAKGSVVRATVGGEERLFFSYGRGETWVADRPIGRSGLTNIAYSAELTVLDVVLDASTL